MAAACPVRSVSSSDSRALLCRLRLLLHLRGRRLRRRGLGGCDNALHRRRPAGPVLHIGDQVCLQACMPTLTL